MPLENNKIKKLEQEKIILEEIINNTEKSSLFLRKRFYVLISAVVVLAYAGKEHTHV